MAIGLSLAALLVGCGPTRNLAKYLDDAVRAWEGRSGVFLATLDRDRIEAAARAARTRFDDALNAIPDDVRAYADDALCAGIDLADGKSLEEVAVGVVEPYQVELRQAVQDIEAELNAGQPYQYIARSALVGFACAAA